MQTVIEETLIVLPHASQSANLCFCWINPAFLLDLTAFMCITSHRGPLTWDVSRVAL